MAKLVLNGATSGSVTLDVPATAGSNTLTLPANTGTVITTASTFGGTGPAFRAYQGTLQSISDNVNTKLTLNTESFDTNSCYDTSLYRFTPNIAGYYFISAELYFNSASVNFGSVFIFKNGSIELRGLQMGNGSYLYTFSVSGLVYCNGTTDYIEIYGYQNSGVSKNTEPGSTLTYVSGFLARAA